jgi:hypothetical protein
MTPPDNKPDTAEILEKIKILYHNYGIDTANMTEEEFDRLIEKYSSGGNNLDKDLFESEKHKERFLDDMI